MVYSRATKENFDIITASIGIQNMSAACGCACRYCLLRSDKSACGVDYYRGKRMAERFAEWGRAKRLKTPPFYFVAYCAEYPELIDNILYNKSIGFSGAGFLQLGGIAIRDEAETDAFMKRLKVAGITMIDETFYGNREYHDAFAARKGDFDFMLRVIKSAAKHGITPAPSMPVTRENAEMLAELIPALLEHAEIGNIHAFLPDYRGRGSYLEDARLTDADCANLPEILKSRINLSRHKTEREWLADGDLPAQTTRNLTITLRADNIETLEAMSVDEIIAYAERLDDEYHAELPPARELMRIYGNRNGRGLYRARDLYWKWQNLYRKQHGIDTYDVTDERFISAVRN